MAIKDKLSSRIKGEASVKLSYWSLLIASSSLLGLLWLSGAKDTNDAMNDGRRLLIKLDTGTIEGKQISLETPEPVADAPAATQPATATSPAAVELPDKATEPAAATKPATQDVAPAAAAATTTTTASTEPTTKETPDKADSDKSNSDKTGPENVTPDKTASDKPAEPLESPSATLDTSSIKPSAVPPAEIKSVLIEKTDVGNLPTVGPKGLKPWSYYAKRYVHKGHLPTIAIVITGLGQNHNATESAIRLPENVSLSFSPYAKESVSWAQAARIAGHEILVDLPLEPSNFPATDPGPYGLLVGKGLEENSNRLKWLMSRLEGYVGFMTPFNEAFTSEDAAFKDILDQLSTRGLMIAMPHDPAKNDTKKIMDNSKTAYTIADAVVDEELSVSSIQARLMSLEKTASKRGFAIGVAQAYPLTIQQLALWSADLEKNGYTLVPLTFITKIKFPAT